jgi:LPXTG-motif cell wall-anchored protein
MGQYVGVGLGATIYNTDQLVYKAGLTPTAAEKTQLQSLITKRHNLRHDVHKTWYQLKKLGVDTLETTRTRDQGEYTKGTAAGAPWMKFFDGAGPRPKVWMAPDRSIARQISTLKVWNSIAKGQLDRSNAQLAKIQAAQPTPVPVAPQVAPQMEPMVAEEGKSKTLWYVGGGAVVLLGGLWFMGRKKKKK